MSLKLRPFRPARAGRTETLVPPASGAAPLAEREVDLRTIPPGLLAIPATEWMWTGAVLALNALSRALPPGSGVSYGTRTSVAATNRNYCVMEFLRQPRFQWLLFCDSDAVPPKHTFAQLWIADKDIIGGTFLKRSPPFHLAAEGLDPAARSLDIRNGVQEIARIGFHCVLLRRRVLEQMPSPWFENPVAGAGEDYQFCDKARALGFHVFMDSDLEVGHVTAMNITLDVAAAWRAAHSPDGLAQMAAAAQRSRDEYRQRCATPTGPHPNAR